MVIALVVILLGGAAVSALTSFNIAMIRSHSARQHRLELEHEVNSVLEVAVSNARRDSADPARSCSVGATTIDDVHVDITCSSSSTQSKDPVPGLVTTLHSSTIGAQTLPTWSGGAAQALDGAIVINTGTQTSPNISLLADRELDSSAVWTAHPVSWTSFTSSTSPANSDTLPALVPIPPYERPGAQALIGTCNIYFPGRYLGSSTMLLSGGHHYFASGVYYFERPLAVGYGARVVMGSGSTPGCSDDSEAVTANRSPIEHAISGTGVTLIFGGAGRLAVQDSSLVLNVRNAGAEPSIRTIGSGTSTTALHIPSDVVRLEDGSSVPITAHSVLPPESSTPVSYKATTLSPTSSFAVSVSLNGSLLETNRFVVEGQIFVPHAAIHLASSKSAYRFSLTGGMVTTRLTTAIGSPPTGPGAGFDIGYVPNPNALASAHSMVTIEARADNGSRSFTSSVDFSVTDSSWTLVSRSRRHERHDVPGQT